MIRRFLVLKMKFPRKAWMPFCVTPQRNLLNHLYHRKFLQLRRRGIVRSEALYAAEEYESECELKYHLIDEPQRLKLNTREWDAYKKMTIFEQKRFEQEMAIFT